MLENDNDALDLDIDELFKEPITDEPDDQDNGPSAETKAVSERINEVKRKTQAETRDAVAKEQGYNSYEEMQKANEQKLFRDNGLDEAQAEELIKQLVEKRIANDPRFKRLEEIENTEKINFVNAQLKDINKLSGGSFSKIEDLPEDTLKLWEKTGNLKQAYLATHGEELLNKRVAAQSNGSLEHLGANGTNGTSMKTRGLTSDEKAIYKSILGDYITDDELNKKTIMSD